MCTRTFLGRQRRERPDRRDYLTSPATWKQYEVAAQRSPTVPPFRLPSEPTLSPKPGCPATRHLNPAYHQHQHPAPSTRPLLPAAATSFPVQFLTALPPPAARSSFPPVQLFAPLSLRLPLKASHPWCLSPLFFCLLSFLSINPGRVFPYEFYELPPERLWFR